jgi:acetoin utilization protein AcuB
MKLHEIMTAPVLTVTPGAPASDALARMRDAGVRHAVVVSGGAVVGVVSERDLGGPAGGAFRAKHVVGDLMQRQPVVGSPDLDVGDAAALVRERRIGCIPVADRGKLVGIVTRGDLLGALAHLERRDRAHVTKADADLPRPPRLVSPNRDKWP